VYRSIYTQQHLTVSNGLLYNYYEYQNILCMEPIIHNITSWYVVVCSKITVNITFYSISSQLHTTTRHCHNGLRYNYCPYHIILYIKPVTHNTTSLSVPVCSTITVNIIYTVYQDSYTQQHITVSTVLRYSYSQYHIILYIKPVTYNNTSLSVKVCGTITLNITI
jgi:hypothetical protein